MIWRNAVWLERYTEQKIENDTKKNKSVVAEARKWNDHDVHMNETKFVVFGYVFNQSSKVFEYNYLDTWV